MNQRVLGIILIPLTIKVIMKDEKILIITRARVRFKKMLDFLINTSKASKSIKHHEWRTFL